MERKKGLWEGIFVVVWEALRSWLPDWEWMRWLVFLREARRLAGISFPSLPSIAELGTDFGCSSKSPDQGVELSGSTVFDF